MTAAALPQSGVIVDAMHSFPIRVYYEDTDAAGIVYYANYLKFAERARTELLRLLGFEHGALQREHGLGLAVRRSTIEYLVPARLDDALVVTTRLDEAAGAALDLAQDIWRGDCRIARLKVRVACVSSAGRPRRLPSALVAALNALSPTRVPEHAR